MNPDSKPSTLGARWAALPRWSKALLWGFATFYLIRLTYSASRHAIFPRVDAVENVQEHGIGPLARTFTIQKHVMVPNPWDAPVKIGLLIITLVCYWMVLSNIIRNPIVRFVVFLASLWLGYYALLWILW